MRYRYYGMYRIRCLQQIECSGLPKKNGRVPWEVPKNISLRISLTYSVPLGTNKVHESFSKSAPTRNHCKSASLHITKSFKVKGFTEVGSSYTSSTFDWWGRTQINLNNRCQSHPQTSNNCPWNSLKPQREQCMYLCKIPKAMNKMKICIKKQSQIFQISKNVPWDSSQITFVFFCFAFA